MRPELVKAAELLKSDDPQAINRAIGLMHRTVFSFSMKVCGHREDAEDTAQDVLLKSVPYLKKIDGPKALAVWLYKVTRNRCWMSRRKSKFAPDHVLSLDEFVPDSAELHHLIAHRSDTSDQLASEQDAERVRAAVLRIPPRYRLILVLHDMEDLDTAEVAKVVGLKEGTVRVRLHRARLFVRRELASEGNHKAKLRKKRAKPMSCRQMFAGLSEFLDGRLDDLSCERVEKHLADCPACIAFLEDLREAVDRCRGAEVPCEANLSSKIKKVIADEYLRLSSSSPAK
jgi:RNA polymerase sigma-70 factor, ECF subfamily